MYHYQWQIYVGYTLPSGICLSLRQSQSWQRTNGSKTCVHNEMMLQGFGTHHVHV